MIQGLPGVTWVRPSNGPVSYLKLVARKLLSAVMSDARTRVVLPPTGAPPGFDVNVVSGRVSCCFSKEPNANSLFLTIGPPAHTPVVCVVKFNGLKRSPAAVVPTNPEHVSTFVKSEQFSLRVR